MNQLDKIRYLFDTHLHTLENIKFADQKSLVIIALNPAILSALYGSKLIIVNPQKGWLLIILSFTTFTCLLLGLLFAVLVIYPRGEKIMREIPGGELSIPFKIIDHHPKVEDFIKEINNADESCLVNNLCAIVYSRSRVQNIKYSRLRNSILISGIDWLGGLILLLIAAITI